MNLNSDNEVYGFPDHNIDPKKKGRSFIMKYGKAMYNTFNKSDLKVFYNRRSEYREYVRYAQGKQSIDQYKKRLGCDDDKDNSWVNLNWQILNIGSKFVNVVTGMMNKLDYSVSATPIDILAIDAKKEYEAKIKTYQELGVWMKKSGIKYEELGLDIPEEEVPRTPQETEIHINLNYKHRMAIEMEMAIDMVFYHNNWKQVKKEVQYELVVKGCGAIRIDRDHKGFPTVKALDCDDVIAGVSKSEDFSKVPHAGVVNTATWPEFVTAAKGEFSKEDLDYIATHHTVGNSGSDQYQYDDSRTGERYNQKTIRYLDFEFISNNDLVYESKTDKRGNKKTYRADFNRGKSKNYKEKYKEEIKAGTRGVQRIPIEAVYKGKWIIGSDYIFDYGLKTNMARAKNDIVNTGLSFKIFAPNWKNGTNTSLVQQMIPMLDAIQLNWLKIQDAVAKAIPKGAHIDLEHLEGLALGKGGSVLTPKEALNMFFQRGITIGRKSGRSGRDHHQGAPITERENGMAADVMRFTDLIQYNIGMIRDITGVNEAIDSSSPDPKVLKSVSELAAQGANNALDHLFHAFEMLLEYTAKDVCLHMQDYVKNNKGSKGLVGILGASSKKFWEVNAGVSLHTFGIKIERKPDDLQWQEFYMDIREAVKSGVIGPEDQAFVREIDNLKVARQYLANAAKKHRERQEASAMQQSEHNAKVQTEAVQQQEELKQATLQMEINGKMELEQLKGTNAVTLEGEKRKSQTNVANIGLSAKLKQAEQLGANKVKEVVAKSDYAAN